MTTASVYFVGTEEEAGHHAKPIADFFRASESPISVKVAPPEQILSEASPGDLVTFYSEHFERFRHACQVLKTRNVATLYMIDGILEWRNSWVNQDNEVASPYAMRPVLSHKVACIGNSQARVLESWGNSGKTEVVGIPRLDSLAKSTAARELPEDAPVKILVMTAKTPAFTDSQWKAVRASLHDLKDWMLANPTFAGRDLRWNWRLTMGLEKELEVENLLNDLTGRELGTCLQQSDLVICTPSTAMLEAMLADVPVACLDYHNCPHYVVPAWDIASREHIQPAIETMIRREECRMQFQRNQLYDALYLETPATQRMCELITQMLRIADEQATDHQLEFPKNLLPQTQQVSCEFAHQRLFPSVHSFQINNLARLQVEHSQSRREIERLKSEVAQLKSELNQAHQIFDTIQQHPIAGPVVRIRQKILDFMASFKNRSQNPELNPAPVDHDSIHNE